MRFDFVHDCGIRVPAEQFAFVATAFIREGNAIALQTLEQARTAPSTLEIPQVAELIRAILMDPPSAEQLVSSAAELVQRHFAIALAWAYATLHTDASMVAVPETIEDQRDFVSTHPAPRAMQ